MALGKLFTDERGVTAKYFRVKAVVAYYDDLPEIIVQMDGYADESYRLAEKGDKAGIYANTHVEYRIPLNEQEELTRPVIYSRLKMEVPMFANAEDILEAEQKESEVIEDDDQILNRSESA